MFQLRDELYYNQICIHIYVGPLMQVKRSFVQIFSRIRYFGIFYRVRPIIVGEQEQRQTWNCTLMDRVGSG